MNNPLLDYLNKAVRISTDITEFYQVCTLRYLKACEDLLDGKPVKTADDIQREVRAEFLAAGRAVPK